MASRVSIAATCDACALSGQPPADSAESHTISIDGGPLKNIDLCAADARNFGFFLAVYRQEGQEPPSAETEQRLTTKAKKKAHKAVVSQERLELVVAPEPAAEPEKAQTSKLTIVCPHNHPASGGGSKLVNYVNRSAHAKMVHDREAYEIVWGDPDRILKVPCTSHKECLAVGLRFTSQVGLRTHTRASPLELIDKD